MMTTVHPIHADLSGGCPAAVHRGAESGPARDGRRCESRTGPWAWIASFLALLSLAATTRAQEVTANAEVNNSSVYVGDSIVFRITVDGARDASPPDLTSLDGFQAEFAGGQDQSSSMSWNVNGRVTQQTTQRYIMQWRLTPTKAGTLTIPPLRISAGGKTTSTQAIRVVAAEPGDHPDFKLVIEPEKTIAFVGEPVVVKIVWYLGKGARNAQIGGHDGAEQYDVFPAPDPRPIGAAPDDEHYPQVRLMGHDAFGTLAPAEWDGRQVTTYTQHIIVVPRKPGKVTIGPMNAAFDAVTGQRRRSFFDAPWDDRSTTERVVLASNSATIEARALPAAGRPPDFAGLVGDYTVATSLSAVEAGVGDPITLTVRIGGQEPMAGVAAPDLTRAPGFVDGFKLSPEGWDAKTPVPGKPGERVYSTTVRPQSEGVKELPAISLSYFDTKSGTYRSASSAPIPLKVRSVRTVTAADAIGGGGVRAIAPAGPLQSVASSTGVRANFGAADALSQQRLGTLGLTEWAAAGTFALAPPAAIALAAAVSRRRASSRGADNQATASSLRQARRALGRARAVADVRAVIAGALARSAGMSPAAVTAFDTRALRHSGAAAALEAVLQRCDRAEFGSDPVAIDAIRRDALNAINVWMGEVNA